MEIAGYLAGVLIGISLGLIGGGGSIFTMPILVYLFRISPPLATSYSLFVVGSTSLVGAVNNYKKGWINIKTALQFGLSSIATVCCLRAKKSTQQLLTHLANQFLMKLLPHADHNQHMFLFDILSWHSLKTLIWKPY